MAEPTPNADAGTPSGDAAGGASRLTFRRSQRLTHDREYRAAFAAKARKSRGPLTVYATPNGLGHSRLGLSVGRRIGGAVERNRFKRLMREAFRLEQHRLPAGYDLVVTVRPHEFRTLAAYRRWLVELADELADLWRRRASKRERRGGEG